MALDQVHEQNNKKILGASGSIHLINRNTSLMERWETSSLEIPRIVKNFERHTRYDFNTNEKPLHEDIVAFQNKFYSDVKEVIEGMDVNPVLQNNLVKISNISQVYDHPVHLTLYILC